ncbi:MFS transporter [Desulfoplanes formicivorans]|uniref:MFS transporter n=1 Tax=Desulfoplanes formicivorans TaxID=1592317 RepID=A0A194AH69_9BACT|nr:MFS transporter [Desulfoplanes formicivorans]GAU09427.1 MFS transporter [Desulfoplanes formicivorans]
MARMDERTAGLYTITLSQFALVFMLSAVAVAVPALGREFGASASRLGLVESGYISAAAMLLLPVTRLAEKIGRGTTFAGGILLFSLISFILPQARTIDQFIVLRVFQGGGGAMMISTGLAILADLYPGAGRARALGIASAGIYLGLSAGPWLGGILVTHLGWRWIFYSGAVPCLLGFFLSLKTLPVRPVIVPKVRFDWLGALLCALGMIMISQGGSHLQDATGILLVVGGLFCLVAFVFWESHARAPLLDMSIFSNNPSFSLGSLVQFMSYASTFGVTFLLSLYLQVVQGMTASQAGIILMAQPVVQVIFSLVSGNWCERWPAHHVATLGMTIATLGLAAAIPVGHGATLPHLLTVLILCGAGNAIFATANTAVIMGAVQREWYGVASAVVAGARTTGMTFGLVFISGMFALIIGPGALDAQAAPLFVRAMHGCFIVLTLIGGLGVALSHKARLAQKKGSMSR